GWRWSLRVLLDGGREVTGGRSGGGRNLVEEAVDAVDAAAVEDGDVEADDHRGAVGRPEFPAEAGLLVVGVDRAGEPEDQAGELRLDRGDAGVDGLAAAEVHQRVDVGGPVGEDAGDGRAAGDGIGGVPDRQVLGDEVVHAVSPR